MEDGEDAKGVEGAEGMRARRRRLRGRKGPGKGQATRERALRRLESNERERMRMHDLNDAFQVIAARWAAVGGLDREGPLGWVCRGRCLVDWNVTEKKEDALTRGFESNAGSCYTKQQKT